jgi:hypothetical protein
MAGRAGSAEELAQELAEAVAANDTRRAITLTREIEAQLEASLSEKRVPGTTTRRQTSRKATAVTAVVPVGKAARRASSARQTVTAALAEIGVPARARLVADYCEARFGERIDTRAFSALRRDERRAWSSSSSRPTYIVPALEGRFFQPIRGLLALSDWPIERRLIGPWSERADHLAATIQLAKQLAWVSERDLAVAKRLASILAGMCRSIPGALEGNEVEPGRVEAAAADELREVTEHDGPWRAEASTRARLQLSAEEQLWGSRVAVIGAEEG